MKRRGLYILYFFLIEFIEYLVVVGLWFDVIIVIVFFLCVMVCRNIDSCLFSCFILIFNLFFVKVR